MTAIAKPRDRQDAALFTSGLVALTAMLAIGTLAVVAVAAMAIPGYSAASIRSESMSPTLRVGDVVIGVDHGDGRVAPGNVVTYVQPGGQDLVTHRVVSVNPDGSYVTKGDATSLADASIPAANLRSQARWVVPYVGLPRVWFLQHEWARLILVIAATALVLRMTRFAFDARYDPWPTPPPAQVESDVSRPAPMTVRPSEPQDVGAAA